MSGKLKPGWKVIKFEDIAENIAKRVSPANAETDIYVGLEHLDTESLKLRQWGHPSDVSGEKLEFKKGDIIFGRRRAYQRKLAVAEFDGICSAHAMVLRAKPEMVHPDFFPFFLKSDMFMERAIEISVGSLSPTINWKALRVQEFPLPPLDEQRRIAEILWAADEVVESTKKIYNQMTNAYEKVASILFKKGTENEPLVNSKVGNVPSSWKILSLQELTQKDAPIRYGIVQVGKDTPNGVPTLAIKDLVGDFVNGVHRTNQKKESQYINSRVQPGDILISIKASIGEVNIVPPTFKGNISRDLARIRVGNKILPLFLFHLLSSQHYKRYINKYVVGSTRKELSIHILRRLLVPLPAINEQKKIINILEAFKKQLNEVKLYLNDISSRLSINLREEIICG